jgi:tetratricopeptide (TPR) repeat protein
MRYENPFQNFDYRVECDDFMLYELSRLIEEDRASLQEEEFRRVIEFGIHDHIERRLDIRATMAFRLRSGGAPADRLLRAIEDVERPLRDLPLIVESYTGYLFRRLEECSETPPDERLTAAADVLVESPEDRQAAERAIGELGAARSAVSARVLAYAVSEPMLEEDLEMKAYAYLRAMWPLPRQYVLYSLKPHTHEDLPFRWFQLLIECDEPSAVDRILEEFVIHGGNDAYREDLAALVPLLEQARDPETEVKILQVLNSPNAPKAAVELLEDFLKRARTPPEPAQASSPWKDLERVYAANRRYLSAAKLFDAGKKSEAVQALEELLIDDPHYPFALMLKQLA